MGVNLAIGAVGAGLNAGLNMAVAGKQQAIAAENAGMQGGLYTQATGDVGQAVGAAAGAPGAAGGYGAYSAGQYATALAGAGGTSAAPSIAGADPRYAKANATNAASVGNYTGALTHALSTAQGVQTAQRMAQQQEMTEATNVSALQSESYADTLVNQMRQQSIKANPLLAGIAQGMMAVGGMSSLSGLGSKNGIATPYDTASSFDQGFTDAGTPIAAGGTDVGSSLGDDLTSGAEEAA